MHGALGTVSGLGEVMKHTCHAMGCDKVIPRRLLMCPQHWRKVPYLLRNKVWDAYVSGQEVRGDPSPEYLETAREAIDAVARKEGLV